MDHLSAEEVRRAVRAFRFLFGWGLALAAGPLQAHTPDTSYVRAAVAQGKLDLRFTLDVFTLQKITGIDANGDHILTPPELQAAVPVVERFLREHVQLELDEKPAPLGDLEATAWPRDVGDAMAESIWHTNDALIAFNFHQTRPQPIRDVSILFNVFEIFGIRHTVLGAFECAGTSEEVTFTQPEPDYLFDTAYAGQPSPPSAGSSADAATSASPSAPPPAHSPLWSNLYRFFRMGVEHIFLGYDHICFLLALLLVGQLRELVKIVTSFTVAHCLTLILAALQVVKLPGRWVECAIAATIVYIALENVLRRDYSHRWRLTFCFGLIHGFGFASVLVAAGLPTVGRVRCLLSFNLGVEAAQLAIILAMFPFIRLLMSWRYGRFVRLAVNLAVGLFGLNWFTQRAFQLGFLPM